MIIIYLIIPGAAVATSNNERGARAFEQVGFMRCSKEEYNKLRRKLEREDGAIPAI